MVESLKAQIEREARELHRLRDQIRLDLHLAGLDPDRLRDLDPEAAAIDRVDGEVSEAAKVQLERGIDRLSRLRRRLELALY